MTFICGTQAAPPEALRVLTKMAECCVGALEEGPVGCSCWEPVYDLVQVPPHTHLVAGTRHRMCDDCAYRHDSPEHQGDDRYQENLSDAASPFWCHQGMRKPVAWRHPAGITVTVDVDAYTPPVVNGVPYKANGEPGERCAGWAAAHRQPDDSDIEQGSEFDGPVCV